MANFTVFISDNINFNDINKNVTVIHENIILTDTTTGNIKKILYVTDGIKLTASPKTVESVNVSDEINFSDNSNQIYPCYAYDHLRIADASFRWGYYSIHLYDDFGFSDNWLERFDFSEIISDDIILSPTTKTIYSVFIDEKLILTEISNSIKYYIIPEIINFIDISSAKLIARNTIEDGITLVDDIRPTIQVAISENIVFSDHSEELRARKDVLDVLNINDKTEVFDRFYTFIDANDITLSDTPFGNISEFIKRLGTNIILTDNTSFIAYYRNRFQENIVINDESTNRKISPSHHEEEVNINTFCDGSVYFHTALQSNSELILSDTAKCIISRYREEYLTNSMKANIGTIESVLYKCLYNVAEVINISLTNRISSSISVSVMLYKYNATNPINIVKDVVIDTGETFIINKNEKCVTSIEKDDEIRIISSSDSSVDAYAAIIDLKQGN